MLAEFDTPEYHAAQLARWNQRLEESRENLIREESALARAREKVATVTGRSLGWWKNELRRASGAVVRQRANIEEYYSLINCGAAIVVKGV